MTSSSSSAAAKTATTTRSVYSSVTLLVKLLLVLASLALVHIDIAQAATTSAAEKVLADRQKSAEHIQHAMDTLHLQLDGHKSGSKPLSDKRLKSLAARLQKYEAQLQDLTRTLSQSELDELVEAESGQEL